LNKDEIDNQKFDQISKCADLQREIVAFAPEQNVKKHNRKLKVLKQNGAPAVAKRTFSSDAFAR
jgi:hypothetical protein